MIRESFVFYASFWQAMKKMNKTDKLAFVEALCGYALEDEAPALSGNADLAFGLIKPQLDANIKRRVNGEKGKEFGKMGGRPLATENPNGVKKENPNGVIAKTPNVNVYKECKCIDKEESIEKKGAEAPAPQRMPRPTLEEVAAYAATKHYTGFNAERFYAYYESNGWKVGRNPMKSWKNAVTSWHFRDQEKNKPSADYISRTYIPDPSIYENIQSTI